MNDEWQKDREVIDAATDGPWRQWGTMVGVPMPPPNDDDIIVRADGKEDARFIARARTRWPAALDEIDRLKRELQDHASTAESNWNRYEQENARRRTLIVENQVLRQERDLAVQRLEEAKGPQIDSHKPGPPEPPRGRNA